MIRSVCECEVEGQMPRAASDRETVRENQRISMRIDLQFSPFRSYLENSVFLPPASKNTACTKQQHHCLCAPWRALPRHCAPLTLTARPSLSLRVPHSHCASFTLTPSHYSLFLCFSQSLFLSYLLPLASHSLCLSHQRDARCLWCCCFLRLL